MHFVEYGLIAFLFYRVWRTAGDPSCLLLPVLAGLFVGLAEEWLQWFIPVRVGELHDVLLNLVAVSCGLVFSVAADPPPAFSWRLYRRARGGGWPSRPAGWCWRSAFFIDQVHLGHAIDRAGLGAVPLALHRSPSRWSCRAIGRRRGSSIRRWCCAGCRAKTNTWTRRCGTCAAATWSSRTEAWAENRILETFYAPVLDTPSLCLGDRPSLVAGAARRHGSAGRRRSRAMIVSAAEPYPIYTFPRWWLWSAALTVVAALSSLATEDTEDTEDTEFTLLNAMWPLRSG